MHKLHDLKSALVSHLEEYADRELTASDLKTLDTLAHATKNIGKVIEMCEEEGGGSSFRMGGAYRMSGRVYADERPRVGGYTDTAYRSRDARGRYSSREGGSAYGEGYAEASADMRDQLDSMMREARSEKERQTIEEMMSKLGVRG